MTAKLVKPSSYRLQTITPNISDYFPKFEINRKRVSILSKFTLDLAPYAGQDYGLSVNIFAAGSSAFSALIWWSVPAAGLVIAIGYVVWVSKFQNRYQNETNRSVSNFQNFQDSFRDTSPVLHRENPTEESEQR